MKFNVKKTKDKAGKFFKILAERSFVTSLLLIFVALLIGGWLFYKYNIVLEETTPSATTVSLKLQEQAYNDILNQWASSREDFLSTTTPNYINPFSTSSALTKQ